MFSDIFGKARRIHYAWVILGAVLIINTLSSGLRLSFGVFIDPLQQQFHWSKGAISFGYTVSFLAALPATFLVGRLGDMLGVRRLVGLAAITTTVGLVLTAYVTQLWQLYIFYGVIVGGLGNALYQVLLPVTVTRWFAAKIGLAMGIMWTSLSIGPIILSPLMRWMIETQGWKPTLIIIGSAIGAGLIAMSFLLHSRPEDKGLQAYGAKPKPAAPAPGTTAAPAKASISFAEVRRQPTFWALILTHFLGCVSHAIPLSQVVSMATFNGIPGVTAALVLSVFSATALGSRFFMSLLSERKGSRITLALAFAFQAAPMLILLWAHQLWGFFLFAVLFGIGYGGEMVGYPIFNRQLYGDNAPLNMVYSYEMIGALCGMALGGWVGGAMFDFTGGYTWTIIIASATGFLGFGIAFLLPRHKSAPKIVEVPQQAPAQ